MGEESEVGPARAVASYVSTNDVIARECAVMVAEAEGNPRYWRGFTVRHLAVAVVLVLVPVLLHVAGRASSVGALRGVALLLVVFAGLTAMDVWRTRRRLRRLVRGVVEANAPVGTLLSAIYTPERIVFRLPTHEVVVDLASIVRARYVRRVLLLEQADTEQAWVVPEELAGHDGLRIVRDALGTRFVDR